MNVGALIKRPAAQYHEFNGRWAKRGIVLCGRLTIAPTVCLCVYKNRVRKTHPVFVSRLINYSFKFNFIRHCRAQPPGWAGSNLCQYLLFLGEIAECKISNCTFRNILCLRDRYFSCFGKKSTQKKPTWGRRCFDCSRNQSHPPPKNPHPARTWVTWW